ncbi:aminotransferase class I/II-fold pyridoxal phosphate-dependent enzyme [Acidiplasma sp.]|uniref:aminotransferase class I/II-fold pyridoxal phosphate-dependent enzyme n=1 Tax=Acidiplasma sp. TaxID=1872114 RepID=UPI0025835AE6|nr:aminotransferase class I/II-fold pyridoxal phosphate-dependent enzyme [Acidiplasma sp.]
MLNNPVNPTGKVYSERTLRQLSDFILENNLFLISDEIYEDLIYKGKMFSPGSINEMKEKTVTLSGFSKSYAMTDGAHVSVCCCTLFAAFMISSGATIYPMRHPVIA